MSLIKMEMIRSDEAESYFNRLRNAIEVQDLTETYQLLATLQE